jgi:hypothetical protein
MAEEYFYEVGASRVPVIEDENSVNYFPKKESVKDENDVNDDVDDVNDVVNDVEKPVDDVDINDADDADDIDDVDDVDGTDDKVSEKYKGYSDAALYGEQLKQSGFFPEDFELEKEIDHEDLIQNMVKTAEQIAIENAEAKLIEKYGSAETLQAAAYLRSGGDPLFLNKAAAVEKMASLDLNEESNQEKAILFAYKMKGIEEEDARVYIETHRERGELEEKARKASEYLGSLKEEFKSNINTPKDNNDYEAMVAERNSKIQSIVKSKAIGPYKLTDKDSKELLEFITKPKFAVKVSENEVTRNKFVTGLEKKYAELGNDLTKQVLIAKILMDDFNFTPLESEIKNKTMTGVLDTLNRKSKKRNKVRKNAFLQE